MCGESVQLNITKYPKKQMFVNTKTTEFDFFPII